MAVISDAHVHEIMIHKCLCVCVRARMFVCVCVCERERERMCCMFAPAIRTYVTQTLEKKVVSHAKHLLASPICSVGLPDLSSA